MSIDQLSHFSSYFVLLAILLPVVSFIINIFFKNKFSGWIGTSFIGLSFLLSIVLFFVNIHSGNIQFSYHWFSIPPNYQFAVGILLNNLASILLIIVTFISMLVHLYSIEYMKKDEGFSRYFAFLGLFTFSMLGIVLADNLLLIFIFWELVGFSSYLLIGFWFFRSSAVVASRKAFIVNRIGDAGFLVGILILWTHLGTLDLLSLNSAMALSQLENGQWLSSIFNNGTTILSSMNEGWLTVAGIALFCGAIGKSAQFPLQIWLPDAMEGPTPVSALIHAATMVAAGVYLIARIYFLFNPDALTIIAFIGAITAFMGAVAALNQHDIKKVLAFSTISQLGFMVMGMGVGAYDAAIFHLITHAFFKACLFLCAGAVIHAMHQAEHTIQHQGTHLHFDVQDMKLMGGLKNRLPLTFWTYTIAAMSLAGIPLFSGFLSKDAILTGAVAWAALKSDSSILFFLVPDLGFIAAFLTAFYIGRQLFLVFFGELRLLKLSEKISPLFIKEAPLLMKIPLVILALLSIGFVFSLNPIDAAQSWILPFLHIPDQVTPDRLLLPEQEWLVHNLLKYHYPVMIASIVLTTSGGLLAWYLFGRNIKTNENYLSKPLSTSIPGRLSYRNWFLDDIYQKTVVKGTYNAAVKIARFDKKIIDKFIEYLAILQVVLAHLIAWFDKTFVDGIVNFGAFLIKRTGSLTRSFQQGSIQAYLISSLIGIILLIAWIII